MAEIERAIMKDEDPERFAVARATPRMFLGTC